MNITAMTFVAPNLACGKARGGSISQSGSVTDEQRRHRPNSAQPFGRQFFFGQTSLLAPHRPLKGMLVARASSGRKIPPRGRHRSYAHDLYGAWISRTKRVIASMGMDTSSSAPIFGSPPTHI